MSTIFRFRMLSDENDYFIREYDVPNDISLAELNDFICDDLRFDKGGITSFFTSNALWEKEREFTREDMSAPGPEDDHEVPTPMNGVGLGQVIRRNRDRLLFLFDVFGDRVMYLELTETRERENGIDYPCVTLSKSSPPKQYDAGNASIFDDMMDDFDSFESYEADYADDF